MAPAGRTAAPPEAAVEQTCMPPMPSRIRRVWLREWDPEPFEIEPGQAYPVDLELPAKQERADIPADT
jgi:hypothetical protein